MMANKNLSNSIGFTLIELLIVVAIIAVLAAIAVPNFLLAQTRAKITAGFAGMRSIATALEAYRVDHNGALPGLGYMAAGWADRYRFDIPLTTPVPYMSSVPQDPFYRQAGMNGVSSGPNYYYAYMLIDHNIVHAIMQKPVGHVPGMWSPVDPNARWFDRSIRDWVNYYYEPPFHRWNHAQANFMIRGWGVLYNDGNYTYYNPYDPSNGTLSKGEIVYFQ
jgi:prepilin-type N-terminal cleavage/methylation domain-containing protein